MNTFEAPSSVTLHQMQERLRRTSQASFWIQAVIGAVAAISWLISPIIRFSTNQGLPPNLGSTIAFWITLLMLITLGINLYLTWRTLKPSSASPPPKTKHELLSRLQTVVYVSLVGAFLSVISSSAQMGELLSRAILLYSSSLRLEAPGLLVAVVNTSVALAHLISLTSALWSWGILDRHPENS
jgi:hypothetical protein